MGILEAWACIGLGVIGMFVVMWWLWKVWNGIWDFLERIKRGTTNNTNGATERHGMAQKVRKV